MNSATVIASDLGASSGRVFSGQIKSGKLVINELHRFPNAMTNHNNRLCWDTEYLYCEILKGVACINEPFASIGIDTWGADYALLDKNGALMPPIYAYRDSRTQGVPERIDQNFVYRRSGLPISPYNTLSQLMTEENKHPEHFLMLADYLHYRLCGVIACEYTAASTTQLLSVHTRHWDDELIALIGFDRRCFPDIVAPGTVLGRWRDNPEVRIITPAAHDTASAVAAVPADGNHWAFISSGTWSLMGIERPQPYLGSKNLSNEGGINGNYRILKNIMGLWMLQELRRHLPASYSYNDLETLAQTPFGSRVDASHPRFFAPNNMLTEIQAACQESGQLVPQSPGELTRCILDSLAHCYQATLAELRQAAPVNRIHIIGGGSRNRLLNQLTAQATGCSVLPGPAEAAVIGNMLMQWIALGELSTLDEGRSLVAAYNAEE